MSLLPNPMKRSRSATNANALSVRATNAAQAVARMPLLHRILFLIGALISTGPAVPQTYELEGKWYTMKWSAGAWNGEHRLPNVYCVRFPAASTALELGHGFYNRSAIYLTQVLYPEKTGAFVVASTIPAGRSADEEITRLLSLERSAEAGYGTTYNITETQGLFGRTIGLRIKNVAPRGRNAPFPLVRPIIRPAREPIETLSVHRLFVRGPDRFEVATLQLAATPASETAEAEMTQRLTVLADEIVASLQSCTDSMPVRSPR